MPTQMNEEQQAQQARGPPSCSLLLRGPSVPCRGKIASNPRPPLIHHHRFQGLQVQFVRLRLRHQVREKFFSPRKCLVVLEVVSQPQASVETHELEGPFVLADPLPSRMDSLCVQHMIRRQQEPRTQEPEKGLKPSITMPEDHSRISVGEVNQGIPEVLCRKKGVVRRRSCLLYSLRPSVLLGPLQLPAQAPVPWRGA